MHDRIYIRNSDIFPNSEYWGVWLLGWRLGWYTLLKEGIVIGVHVLPDKFQFIISILQIRKLKHWEHNDLSKVCWLIRTVPSFSVLNWLVTSPLGNFRVALDCSGTCFFKFCYFIWICLPIALWVKIEGCFYIPMVITTILWKKKKSLKAQHNRFGSFWTEKTSVEIFLAVVLLIEKEFYFSENKLHQNKQFFVLLRKRWRILRHSIIWSCPLLFSVSLGKMIIESFFLLGHEILELCGILEIS